MEPPTRFSVLALAAAAAADAAALAAAAAAAHLDYHSVGVVQRLPRMVATLVGAVQQVLHHKSCTNPVLHRMVQ